MKTFNICIMRVDQSHWSNVFLDLADLLAFSIADNGYQVQVTENHLNPDYRNIIIGCHLIDIKATDQIPQGTIILNTEQIGAWGGHTDQRILHFVERFPTWDYSQKNIDVIEGKGIQPPKYLKIGYHRNLAKVPPDVPKDIDVLFYGALNDYRLNILRKLDQSGLKVQRLVGVYGEQRDSFIARSRIVLNLHQLQTKIFEIVRAHFLMNNGKVIVSQFDDDTTIDPDYKDGFIAARYDDIVDTCVRVARSPDILEEYERRSLETIRKFDASKIVGDLLSSGND